MPQSAIGDSIQPGRAPADRRQELNQRISRQCRRLRQGVGANGVVNLAIKGRNDSLEQLTVRLGVIPVIVLPNATSLNATMQGYPGRRPAATETVTLTGGTAPQAFAPDGPAMVVPFTAGGTGQVCTANDSVDTQAKGRALVDILP